MTTATQTRRSVMNVAWSFKRSEPVRAFADCLRGAWKIVKALAKDAAKVTARARRAGGRLSFASPVYSPSTTWLSGQRHGRDRDRIAGQMISRLGR